MCYIVQAKVRMPYLLQVLELSTVLKTFETTLTKDYPRRWNTARPQFIRQCSPYAVVLFQSCLGPRSCLPACIFCRETDLTVLHSHLFFGLSGSRHYTVWQKCLWPAKYWLLSPVSWIWISDSKLGSWSIIWTWMYVETECRRSYEMYSDNVIFHRLFCSCRPFT